MSRCGAACDAGWQCLFIAWSSTTTLSSPRPSAKCPTGRELRPPAPEAGRPPDRRVRDVWCRFPRTKKSLRARDEARGSRGRGLGPGWPRVLLTSKRGAAQRDFDRRRGSPARPTPAVVASGLHFPVNLTFDQHGGLWFTSNVVGGQNPTNGVWYIPPGGRPRQVVKGLAAAGLDLGREQPLRRVNHRPGHRRDHRPPRL
jgi:hypothetical protein